MKFFIDSFQGAVRDGITLLTQHRVLPRDRTSPPYLQRPQSHLIVTVLEETPEGESRIGQAKAEIGCITWGFTSVTLTLRSKRGDWRVWGDCHITYGDDYPLSALQGKYLGRVITPLEYAKAEVDGPPKYKITPIPIDR